MSIFSSSKDMGTVYVLTNASLVGMVKIGYTTRSAAIRARELSTTALPTKFEVFYETPRILAPRNLERQVHNNLVGSRIQDGREFFKCTPEEAQTAIESMLPLFQNDQQPAEKQAQATMTVNVPEGITELVLRFDKVKLADSN